MTDVTQEVQTTEVTPDGGQAAELQQDQTSVEQSAETQSQPETPQQPEAQPSEEEQKHRVRFDKLTKAQRLAEQRAEEAERRLDRVLEALERNSPKTEPESKQTQTQEESEPIPPEFIDPDQYRRDMAEYTQKVAEIKAKKALEARLADQERETAERAAREQQIRFQQEFANRRAKAIQEMPDYEEVAESEDVAISQYMAIAIAADEMGPKIAYFLGKNPDVADRISKMHPALQVMELGTIKAQLLNDKPKPAVSKAPAPIKPLTAVASPASKSLDELSMEEYAAQRKGSR